MTATAIDQPRRAATVGRPGRAALAGAAVAGALLISVPFLVLGGDNSKDSKTATADTVLGGEQLEKPGDFALGPADNGLPGSDTTRSGRRGIPSKGDPAGSSTPSQQASSNKSEKGAGTGNKPDQTDVNNTRDDDQSAETGQSGNGAAHSNGTQSQPRTQPRAQGPTLSSPMSLRSHLSGRCIDVPGSDFRDGRPLWVQDCNNAASQKFQVASDGTLRIKGLCMDVANANYNNGTPIQIARCNGGPAQKFRLNQAHDLVNTAVGKCVDIVDKNRSSGARLQLWSCNGADNQKWSA
jgi:hypothetical protein